MESGQKIRRSCKYRDLSKAIKIFKEENNDELYNIGASEIPAPSQPVPIPQKEVVYEKDVYKEWHSSPDSPSKQRERVLSIHLREERRNDMPIRLTKQESHRDVYSFFIEGKPSPVKSICSTRI